MVFGPTMPTAFKFGIGSREMALASGCSCSRRRSASSSSSGSTKRRSSLFHVGDGIDKLVKFVGGGGGMVRYVGIGFGRRTPQVVQRGCEEDVEAESSNSCHDVLLVFLQCVDLGNGQCPPGGSRCILEEWKVVVGEGL